MTLTLLRLPPVPSSIRVLTTNQSKILDQRYPKSRSDVTHCVTCKGTKVFRWFDEAGIEGTFECPCRDQYRLSRWLWHCGVLARWQRLGWRDFEHLPEDTATAAVDYIENLDAYADSGIGLTLTGPKGTGKTLLAHLILKESISKGRDCYATTFNQMIDEFTGGWQDKEQSRWFNHRLRDAGLLFIDDLGREWDKRKNSGLGENMLETVVRHRTACLLPTIITTNLAADKIEVAYGGHTVSLLSEVARIIEVKGVDIRPAMNEREMDYIKRKLTRPVVLQ